MPQARDLELDEVLSWSVCGLLALHPDANYQSVCLPSKLSNTMFHTSVTYMSGRYHPHPDMQTIQAHVPPG